MRAIPLFIERVFSSGLRPIRSIFAIPFAVLVFSGCASTQFQVTGQTPQQSLCQKPGEQASALVLWGPQWRLEQKDVPMREHAAQRGIEHFFSSSECFDKTKVIRKIGDQESIALSPTALRTLVATDYAAVSHVLFITVRELGPVVKLLSSLALVDGGTEVVLDIRVISPSNGQTIADFTAHWQNGGPLVIKGVATLEQDIGLALQAALKPSGTQK